MVFGLGRKNEGVETFQSFDESMNLDGVLEFQGPSSPKRTGRRVEEAEAEKTPETRRSRFLRDNTEPRSRSRSRGRRIASGALSVVSAAIGVSKAQRSDSGVEESSTHDDCEVDEANNLQSPKKRGWGPKIFRGSKVETEILSPSQTQVLLDDSRANERDSTNITSVEGESSSESGSPAVPKRRESRSLDARPPHSPRRSMLKRPGRTSSGDTISSLDPNSTIFSLYNAESLSSRPSLVPAPSLQDGLADASPPLKSKNRNESQKRRSKPDKKGKPRSSNEKADAVDSNGKESNSGKLDFLVESSSPRRGSQFLPSIILSEACEDMGNRAHKSESSLSVKLSDSKNKVANASVIESQSAENLKQNQLLSVSPTKVDEEPTEIIASRGHLKASIKADLGSGKSNRMPPVSPRRKSKNANPVLAIENAELSEAGALDNLDVEVFSVPKSRKFSNDSANKDSPKERRKSSNKLANTSKSSRPRGDSRSVCVDSLSKELRTLSPSKNSLELLDELPRKKTSRSSHSVIDSKERRKHDAKSVAGHKESGRSSSPMRSKSSDTLTPKCISPKPSKSTSDLGRVLLGETKKRSSSEENELITERKGSATHGIDGSSASDLPRIRSDGSSRTSRRTSNQEGQQMKHAQRTQAKDLTEKICTVDLNESERTVSRALKMLEDLAPGKETTAPSPVRRKKKKETEDLDDNKIEKPSNSSKSRTRKNALDWIADERQGDEQRRSRSRSPSRNRSRSKSRGASSRSKSRADD